MHCHRLYIKPSINVVGSAIHTGNFDYTNNSAVSGRLIKYNGFQEFILLGIQNKSLLYLRGLSVC
jgi:hypothetical protein